MEHYQYKVLYRNVCMPLHDVYTYVCSNLPGVQGCGVYPVGAVLTRSRSTTSSIDVPALIHPEISANTCKVTVGFVILPLTVPSGNTVVEQVNNYYTILCTFSLHVYMLMHMNMYMYIHILLPSGVNMLSRVSSLILLYLLRMLVRICNTDKGRVYPLLLM